MRIIVEGILSAAGIRLNGDRPWDIWKNCERFYHRVLSAGSLGLGESYMEGRWECKDLAEFFRRIIPSDPETKLKKNWKRLLYFFQTAVLNPGRKAKAYEIGEKHYDVGNDLYRQMLDKRIVYSCGYWKGAKNVDEAQEAKLDLICRKLGLKPGEKVLDIGCGWGSFAKYAAEKCGADVVEITSLRNNRPWLGNFARDCPSR
jgi:cyclopropane-fatty-acyl-phospholipid synthase